MATTWSNRVRVVERTRTTVLTRVTVSDGWSVEMRFSADGEPERWDSPMQAAIFGPESLLDALDAAREPFATYGAAAESAANLVAALDAAS